MTAEAQCPVHQAPATDTCGRCGRFVCISCQRLRDRDVFCEECRQHVPDALPLKGWMMFSGLSLLLAPVTLVAALGQVWTLVRDAGLSSLLDTPEVDPVLRLAMLEIVGLAILTGLAAWTAPRFYARRRSAPALIQVFFLVTFLLGLWSRWQLTSRGLAVPPSQDASLVMAAVWLAAFRTSNDVARVFVR
ncbi:MAG: DUF2569 family protein [Myxococcaceae bacterium]|nr:DUF2569 family protein [Myxococcaceae bacterium]